MPTRHMIRSGYRHRIDPQYFVDNIAERFGILYQPDVYEDAGRLAKRLGAGTVIDVGCGSGEKLRRLASEHQVVGIDMGPNIEQCRSKLEFGTWIEHDLSEAGPLPVDMSGGLIVCADVIEHVRDPLILLATLREALNQAVALLISTPERELSRPPWDKGPPENPAHVQEWSTREFGAFMRRAGFACGSIGLTRSHDQSATPATILAVYPRKPEGLGLIEDVLIDGPWPPPLPPRRPGPLGRIRRRLG